MDHNQVILQLFRVGLMATFTSTLGCSVFTCYTMISKRLVIRSHNEFKLKNDYGAYSSLKSSIIGCNYEYCDSLGVTQ